MIWGRNSDYQRGTLAVRVCPGGSEHRAMEKGWRVWKERWQN